MLTLRTLSERIDREIRIQENDITPQYRPNMREITGMSHKCLGIMIAEWETWKNVGQIRRLKKTQPVFEETLRYIQKDLQKNNYWSFWHYAALCITSCFTYVKMLENNKHNTIKLNQQETWDDPNYEVAILGINYVSGILYPNSMARMIKINGSDDVDIKMLCELLVRRIKIIHGEA